MCDNTCRGHVQIVAPAEMMTEYVSIIVFNLRVCNKDNIKIIHIKTMQLSLYVAKFVFAVLNGIIINFERWGVDVFVVVMYGIFIKLIHYYELYIRFQTTGN